VDLWSRELCFGQYRGKRVEDVPVSYLLWTLRSVEDLDLEERPILQAEVLDREARANRRHQRRQYQAPPRTPAQDVPLPAGITPDVILNIISAGRQTLAKRFHPDTGGDLEQMKRVNVAADYLEQQARALCAAGGRAA
jgi:hypothetical protein